MSRIPANYLRLLKDKAAMKEFALKPAGLDVYNLRYRPPSTEI